MVNAYDKCIAMQSMVNYLYEEFNKNPNQHTNSEYDIAVKEYHDFCERIVMTLMSRAPEVLKCIEVEE